MAVNARCCPQLVEEQMGILEIAVTLAFAWAFGSYLTASDA